MIETVQKPLHEVAVSRNGSGGGLGPYQYFSLLMRRVYSTNITILCAAWETCSEAPVSECCAAGKTDTARFVIKTIA